MGIKGVKPVFHRTKSGIERRAYTHCLLTRKDIRRLQYILEGEIIVIESRKAKISMYLSESVHLADKEVEYSMDCDNHYLDINFLESSLFDEKTDLFADAIELIIQEKKFCTFYKCHPVEISKVRCKLFF